MRWHGKVITNDQNIHRVTFSYIFSPLSLTSLGLLIHWPFSPKQLNLISYSNRKKEILYILKATLIIPIISKNYIHQRKIKFVPLQFIHRWKIMRWQWMEKWWSTIKISIEYSLHYLLHSLDFSSIGPFLPNNLI